MDEKNIISTTPTPSHLSSQPPSSHQNLLTPSYHNQEEEDQEAIIIQKKGKIKHLMTENDRLVQENHLLAAFLARHGSKNLLSNMEDEKYIEHSGKNRLQIRSLYALVQKEQEALQNDLQSLSTASDSEIARFRACIESSQMKIQEIIREDTEFKKNFVETQVPAESLLKYFENRLKKKALVIEKYHNKINNLRSIKQKVEKQLTEKEHQGYSLQTIDFRQLKIENSQFDQKLKEKEKNLLDLKTTTNKIQQSFNQKKLELLKLKQEFALFNQSITDKTLTISKLTEELKKVEEESHNLQKVNHRFKQHQISAEMPQVTDYIKQKKLENVLKIDLLTWQRKVNIAEMAAQQAKKTATKQAQVQKPSKKKAIY